MFTSDPLLNRGLTIFTTMLLSVSSAARATSCAKRLSAVAHLHQDLTRYIFGMEQSSRHKAAFASLARPGVIADFGAGSGISARDLAVLFFESKVIGVDLDPAMVAHADSNHVFRNLSFRQGNAEHPVFKNGTLDTAFMSSTLHHLTSYGEGLFDIRHVHAAIRSVVEQLKMNGLFIARDFVIADGPATVLLDLPTTDGLTEGDATVLSTAARFEKFAREFRSSTHPMTPVDVRVVGKPRPGWRRYRVAHRDAVEFVLHKDYRHSWDAEVKEEYTFLTQAQFEDAFAAAGLRVLHSAKIHNGWIVDNRFRGQFQMFDLAGRELPFPATNFVIVGQKIAADEGAQFRLRGGHVLARPKYLRARVMRDRVTQKTYDVVDRPFGTLDVLPYFRRGGALYVLGKQGFPRPILTADADQRRLSGIYGHGFNAEPISFVFSNENPRFAEIERELEKRARVTPDQILPRGPGPAYTMYPSPGMISEVVRMMAIPIRARPLSLTIPGENYSGFESSGVVRPIEATAVLRSAQVGSILDARLEVAVYNLLLDERRPLGPWIGNEIKIAPAKIPGLRRRDAGRVFDPTVRRRRFEPTDAASSPKFLEVVEGTFDELNLRGESIATAVREYVRPTRFSDATISVLPVVRKGRRVLVGLERRDLPAVQMHEGHSDLVTTPAWRLGRAVDDLLKAERFGLARLGAEFGAEATRLQPLGGPYHSSPGITNELVFPFVAEVRADTAATSTLTWVALDDLIEHRHLIRDGHLVITALRLAHALGERN